jgi:hypothetical protein
VLVAEIRLSLIVIADGHHDHRAGSAKSEGVGASRTPHAAARAVAAASGSTISSG